MRVSEFMMRTPACCVPETNLGAAVEILWNRNCGILPVVDAQNRVKAVITDRDICVALGTRERRPGDITVAEVASQSVYVCRPTDKIQDALATMAKTKVRRLPVVDSDGKLVGILSMDDIVLHVRTEEAGKLLEFSSDEVMKTLEAIYERDLPAVVAAKSSCN